MFLGHGEMFENLKKLRFWEKPHQSLNTVREPRESQYNPETEMNLPRDPEYIDNSTVKKILEDIKRVEKLLKTLN
jgi:hypothetical protein